MVDGWVSVCPPRGPGLQRLFCAMAASSERLKDFRIKNLLGKGAFGDVYKVQRVSDGGTYALKKINIASMDTREVTDTLNEIRCVLLRCWAVQAQY